MILRGPISLQRPGGARESKEMLSSSEVLGRGRKVWFSSSEVLGRGGKSLVLFLRGTGKRGEKFGSLPQRYWEEGEKFGSLPQNLILILIDQNQSESLLLFSSLEGKLHQVQSILKFIF